MVTLNVWLVGKPTLAKWRLNMMEKGGLDTLREIVKRFLMNPFGNHSQKVKEIQALEALILIANKQSKLIIRTVMKITVASAIWFSEEITENTN